MDEGAGPNYRPDTTRRGCDGGRQRNADERSSQQYSIYRCVPLTIEMCHRSDVCIYDATMDRRRLAFRSVRPTPSSCTLHFDHSRLLRSGECITRWELRYARSGSASRDREPTTPGAGVHHEMGAPLLPERECITRSEPLLPERECITRPEPLLPQPGVHHETGAHCAPSGRDHEIGSPRLRERECITR